MLTAAVAGDVFASPPTEAVLAAIRTACSSAGALVVVTNYTGGSFLPATHMVCLRRQCMEWCFTDKRSLHLMVAGTYGLLCSARLGQ